jgi:hypothetical protein
MKTAGLRKCRKRLDAEPEVFFGDWPITEPQRAACRKALGDTLDALIALGPRGTPDQASEVLQHCVERYNALDDGFICTIEREELSEILYEIGDLCGLPSDEDWLDEWREW